MRFAINHISAPKLPLAEFFAMCRRLGVSEFEIRNDIPDVLAKWPSREEGPNSYRVPIEKIKENGWSLAAGRYKPVTTEAVSHDAPAEILAEVLEIESRITERGNALLEKFGKKL